jgi:hypothetical protein
VAFCTVRVGRSVDNCSRMAGESNLGAVSVAAGGVVGCVGAVGLLPPQAVAMAAAAAGTAMSAISRFFTCLSFS